MADNFTIDKEKAPEHLHGIVDILNKVAYPDTISDETYAEAAFDLVTISQGGADAVKAAQRIAQFMQGQQRALKRMNSEYTTFRGNVHTWIGWAAHWTQRKAEIPSPPVRKA